MSCPYNTHNMHIKFGKLSDAVAFAVEMGYGYDIVHPRYRWHAKKNYADNFKWKGNPKPEEAYD